MNKHKDVALILAAHGSEAAPDSNAPVVALAEQIRSQELFASVTPSFLMGEPLMDGVLDRIDAPRVVVVPLMTSAGYYLNSVIPGKLAQNEDATNRDWYISSPAGMHARISELMIDRIGSRLQQFGIEEAGTTIVLVGHGTRRNRNSAKSTYELFEELKTAFPLGRNRVAFLDQDPEVGLVAASILEGDTLVVPFLVSRGPHMTVDVPTAFGLPAGPNVEFPIVTETATRGGKRTTVCEQPLAYYPEMADICVELARTAIEQNQTLSLPITEAA